VKSEENKKLHIKPNHKSEKPVSWNRPK